MWFKVKSFLLEFLGDILVYFLPFFIACFLIVYPESGFSVEQQKVLTSAFMFFSLWRFWDGKDTGHRIKDLEHKVSVLSGEQPAAGK